MTLVEPVLMAPLRREWAALKALACCPRFKQGKGHAGRPRHDSPRSSRSSAASSCHGPRLRQRQLPLRLAPMLLDLEKEVITFATQLGFQFKPEVSVQQLRAIEINPYAFELAQVSVQIGYLQWRRDNGFDNDRSPVLQNLDGFQNEDALAGAALPQQGQDVEGSAGGRTRGRRCLEVLHRTRMAEVRRDRGQSAVSWRTS